MKRQSLVFAILAILCSKTSALSLNEIFEEIDILGAISCSDISEAGPICAEEVEVYLESGKIAEEKKTLLPSCMRGSRDCDSYAVRVFAESKLQDEFVLAKVQTKDKEQVWIKSKKANIKPLESYIPHLGDGPNIIYFRPSITHVYADKELTEKVPVGEVLPAHHRGGMLPISIGATEYEYVQTAIFRRDKTQIIEIQINSLHPDSEVMETDPYEAYQKAERRTLRKFYFPAYDQNNRLTYWYEYGSC